MLNGVEKNLNFKDFEFTKNECYKRLHDMGYKTDNGTLFDEKEQKLEFFIYKEIKYTHNPDTSYLNGLPNNIIKDFHNFIISKKLNDRDQKTLINIFKKGLSS